MLLICIVLHPLIDGVLLYALDILCCLHSFIRCFTLGYFLFA